jgi:hypothetical protein
MEYSVSVGLEHLGVRVEAGVAELCYFLGQQLDSVGRITEDNRLVNL